ncbi:MAG TPA: glucose/sorbosone family PQQ-dependent dehydrogenase [Vicinamibacterales bacterium]|nr:glucose/sorbosone family PQQ-dependent dehydrogenase [Vicinamibacterales bacterium]
MLRHLTCVAVLAHTLFQITSSAQPAFSTRVVASGLHAPWEMVWGPDDHLWVTERTGRRVIRVNPTSGAISPALSIVESYDPGVSWHEGVLGLALHPDLLKGVGRDYVYVAYTYDADPGDTLSRKLKVRRYSYEPAKESLSNPVELIANLPAHDDHGGGRLVIGPDHTLYVSRGDNGSNWLANYCTPIRSQELPTAAQIAAGDWSTYEGKILRLNLDGSIPADNPVLNGVRSHIYSYGHRNPQGLAFGPNGLLYSSEHGPGTDDEVNLILPGRNYGWPHVAGYRDDRGYAYANWRQSKDVPCASLTFDALVAPPSVPQQKETDWKGTFETPLRTFFTVGEDYNPRVSGSATIAAGGIEVYSARASGIPGWANSILLPGMTMGRVYRLTLSEDGRSVVSENEELFRTGNRYRDVAIGRDQRTFYFATDNDGLGRSTDPSGASIRTFANPGSILEFKYVAP